ncbi:SHOCT domain-containing protein [Actinoplanes subtropicus]|uniref:SHOCT domain-containing protein n=1 Tax=Actinoplanes subtropicus TaxID=543632 RepID=UPI0004C2BDE6|nr:SHOCT domain-containing protein [Actinoplanes subtropicus]
MGLLRGVARTAVVAGTATAVSNRVSRRQAGRWQRQADQQEADAYYAQAQQQQQYPPQQQQTTGGGTDSMQSKLDALKQLGELKSAGVLSEQEFQQQKGKILGS